MVDVREALLRRHMLEKGKTDACELLRWLGLEAFRLEILYHGKYQRASIAVSAPVGACGADTHLDAKVVIDLQRPLEEEDVLSKIRELPHAAELL